MVTVSSATSTKPTVFPLMQCGSATGDTVTLGCLATGFTPPSLTYAWTRNGAALTDSIQYPPTLKDNSYTGVSQIRVPRQDWENKVPFKCAVTHAAGNGEATFVPKVTVYQKPILKVLASSEVETEASFSCFAKDFSPKEHELKWLRNEVEITNKIDEVSTLSEGREDENGTKLYSSASLLRVPPTTWTEDTTIRCVFKFKDAKAPPPMNESVTRMSTDIPTPCGGCPISDVDVKIIAPTMEDMFLHRKGTVVCQVNINNPNVDKISWENEHGKPMAASSISPPKGRTGIVTLPLEISYDEWSRGEKRYCIVEHDDWIEPLKKVYERIVGGQPQRPSVFMLPPLEHNKQETVTLTCYVKDFSPQEVFVSWLVDDEEADAKKFKFHTTTPVANKGIYSAYGQLTVNLEQWKNDDSVYSCIVYHESVANNTKAIVRSVGHRSFDKTNLVNLNMNIPETCKAQ